jgi:hypothetical protein
VALDSKLLVDTLMASAEEVRRRCGIQLRNGVALREWESVSIAGNRLTGRYYVGANHGRQIFIGFEEIVFLFLDYGPNGITPATVEGEDGHRYHLFVSVEEGEILACVSTPARG